MMERSRLGEGTRGKMCGMRDLNDKFKLSVRSIGEVMEAVAKLVARYKTTQRVLWRGKTLTREALVNAAILHLEGLPQDQQEKALAAALSRLEKILQSEPGETLPDHDVTLGSVILKPKRRSGRGKTDGEGQDSQVPG